eukprot:TRINITY_DN6641_c0_g1_i7.p1 TRINITY_DN6641_c0_g1~~TRINITY_DN6641_c0_g1_i7.p1  ORF type:complete len:619 (-),score=50.73 TRINITY_DN6641_c0_g1_i7:412-2268(-)
MASYALEKYGSWVALLVNLVCLGIYGFAMSRQVLPLSWTSSSGLCSGGLASNMRAWEKSVRLYFKSRRSDDPFDRKVLQLVREARIERGRKFTRCSVHILAPVLVLSLRHIVIRGDGWQVFDDAEYAWHILHQSLFLHLTLGMVMCTSCWLFSARTTGTTYQVWHCLLMARLCWQAVTCTSVYQMFGQDNVNVAVRFIGCLFFGTPKVTLGLNVIYATLKSITYRNLYLALSDPEKDIVAFIWGREIGATNTEVFFCGALWACNAVVEAWSYATVRANLEAKKSSTSEETVKSILVVMCDAVVTVDGGLVLDKPNSDLAHFLVRHPPNNSYKGVSFQEFIGSSDRQRVQEQLTTSSLTPGKAISLTTNLIDGNGAALNVQMYCTCFIDIYGDRAYVIGILEVKDPSYEIGRQDRFEVVGAEMLQDKDNTLQGLRGTGALHAASEPDRADTSSLPSGGSTVTLLTVDHNNFEVFLDLGAPGWPIISTSLKMRQLSGPVTGKRAFVEWLLGSELADVCGRITEAFEQFRNHGATHEHASLGRFGFQPPHAKQAGLEFAATVDLDMSPAAVPGVSGTPACLRFYGVQQREARRKKRRPKQGTVRAGTAPMAGTGEQTTVDL